MSKATDDAYTTDDAYERAGTLIVTPRASHFAGRSLGDFVYLKCGDNTEGMITHITTFEGGISYGVTWSDIRKETVHFPMELQDRPELE